MAQPPPGGTVQPLDQQQPPGEPINQTIPRSPYPAPPPFWKHFTSTNLSRLEVAEAQESFDAAELPYELLVLRPPPPPKTPDQQYTTFNIPHHVVPRPTLPVPPPDQPDGILLFKPEDLIHPPQDSTGATARPHARLLSRLTKSLLLNFLELTTIMAENPRGYSGQLTEDPQFYWAEKINDIGVLTENIAAVINLLRPHQARESVKTMLENRLIEGREEMQRAGEVRLKVEEFLQEVENNGKLLSADDTSMSVDTNGVNGNGIYAGGDKDKLAEIEKARRLWAILDDLDGD
ncbi:Mediator of RNA polymerase II transcription subunit 7 [Neophaeococcomyces mojaviensis]|uniref:Mediator of RNA polymerase II transcription subunit 7 n=1 Tax=Neophaeococcomyces mojaviensis TaxID=3383035 RepID=A0ACC3A9M7_9EURO|nr:Mediator of RNA polymerase II transcription subunit 7 [Knufia sp. JES_112]